ncbi:hypothetical protein BKA69DRAFT_1177972 [Paraphysoderma sedebokerense]|nr:hypothetical protein BKA69DRAFT_1177972 [Paraphysoderma sedebokerense]
MEVSILKKDTGPADMNVLQRDADILDNIISKYKQKLDSEIQVRNIAQSVIALSNSKAAKKDAAKQIEFSNKRVEVLSTELFTFLQRYSFIKERIYSHQIDKLKGQIASKHTSVGSSGSDELSLSPPGTPPATSTRFRAQSTSTQSSGVSPRTVSLSVKSLPINSSQNENIVTASAASTAGYPKSHAYYTFLTRLCSTIQPTVENLVSFNSETSMEVDAEFNNDIWRLEQKLIDAEYELAESLRLAVYLKQYQKQMGKYPPSSNRRFSDHSQDFDDMIEWLLFILLIIMGTILSLCAEFTYRLSNKNVGFIVIGEKQRLRVPMTGITESESQNLLSNLEKIFKSRNSLTVPSGSSSSYVPIEHVEHMNKLELKLHKLSYENAQLKKMNKSDPAKMNTSDPSNAVIAELQNRLKLLEKELESAKSQKSAPKTKRVDLTAPALDIDKERFRELSNMYEASSQMVTTLSTEKKLLEKELEECKLANEEAMRTVDHLQTEVYTLEKQLKDSDNLRKQHSELQKNLDIVKSQRDQLSKENENLEAKRSESSRPKISADDTDVAKLRLQLVESTFDLTITKSHLDQATETNKKLKQMIQAYQQENTALKSALGSSKTSGETEKTMTISSSSKSIQTEPDLLSSFNLSSPSKSKLREFEYELKRSIERIKQLESKELELTRQLRIQGLRFEEERKQLKMKLENAYGPTYGGQNIKKLEDIVM